MLGWKDAPRSIVGTARCLPLQSMESYLASSACVGFLRDVNLTCVEGSWWAALEVAVVCPRTRYITGLMWSPLWFVLCALHKPRMWKASHFFPRFLQFLFPTKVWDCADIWCPTEHSLSAHRAAHHYFSSGPSGDAFSQEHHGWAGTAAFAGAAGELWLGWTGLAAFFIVGEHQNTHCFWANLEQIPVRENSCRCPLADAYTTPSVKSPGFKFSGEQLF